MKRPTWNDPAVIKATAERLLPEVLGWLVSQGPREADDGSVMRELEWGLGGYLDGYAIAKRLDSWDPDAELVGILDGASRHSLEALDDAIAAWVRDNNVTIPLVVGDLVRNARGRWDGEVIDLKPETAEVLVYCAALGHVREGFGARGVYVPFEQLERIGFKT